MLERTHHEGNTDHSICFILTFSECLHTAMEPCLTTHTPQATTSTSLRHWRILQTSIISLIIFTASMVFSPCGCCYTPHSTSRLLRNRMLSNTNSRRRIKQQVWRWGTQHAIRHVGDQHWDRNHKQEGPGHQTGIGMQERSKHTVTDRATWMVERDNGLRSRSLWSKRWSSIRQEMNNWRSLQTIYEMDNR